MANEAVKRNAESAAGDVIQSYNISGGVAIEKGTLLALKDGRAVSGSVTLREAMAGIAAREAIGGAGRTKISVYRKGDFDVLASGAIPVGENICSAGHGNYVICSTGLNSGSQIMGYALETAEDDETFQMRLNL